MTVITTEDEKAGRAEQLNLPIGDNSWNVIALRDELDLITPADFATAIGVNEATLAGWRSTGQGPDYTKAGRTVFYRRDAIRDWLHRQTTKPTIGTALAA